MEQTPTSDNELIAEFIGGERFGNGGSIGIMWKFTNDEGDTNTVDQDELAFHTSWDWLMPVVEKIDKLWTSPNEDGDYPEITQQVMVVTTLPICTSIHTVYRNVVEFIKWYKSQNND